MKVLWKEYVRNKWEAFKSGQSMLFWIALGVGIFIVFPLDPRHRFNPLMLLIGGMVGIAVGLLADMFSWHLDKFREKYVVSNDGT